MDLEILRYIKVYRDHTECYNIKISDAKEGSLCQKVTRFVAFTYEKFEFFMINYEYNTNFNGVVFRCTRPY